MAGALPHLLTDARAQPRLYIVFSRLLYSLVLSTLVFPTLFTATSYFLALEIPFFDEFDFPALPTLATNAQAAPWARWSAPACCQHQDLQKSQNRSKIAGSI